MSKRKDYVGQVFGKLTAVEQCDIDGKPWCLCRCECGEEVLTLANRLVTGARTHCGCSRKKRQRRPSTDRIGEKWGRLEIIGSSDERCPAGYFMWWCRCECGKVSLMSGHGLRPGGSTSCGCSRKARESSVDRTGERWGRLVVIGPHAERCSKGYFMWMCRCDCGKEWAVSGHALRPGGTESCGCQRQPRPDLVMRHEGQVYSDLTVLRREGSNPSGNATWLCRCICGTETVVIGSNLTTGNTKSCGCRLGRSASTTNLKHGRSGGYLGRLYDNIIQRCYRPTNKAYANYGGRGIGLAPEWMARADFIAGVLAEIGERPSPRHSFDRVDNELGYQPGNVRWSTRSEQSLNRRMGRDTEPMKVSAKEMRERIAELEAENARLREIG